LFPFLVNFQKLSLVLKYNSKYMTCRTALNGKTDKNFLAGNFTDKSSEILYKKESKNINFVYINNLRRNFI